MILYISINAMTGEILRSGSAQDIDHVSSMGGKVIEVSDATITPSTHYVDPGTGAVCAKPPKPEGCFEWDAATRSWQFNKARAAGEAVFQRNALLSASDWTQMPDVPTATAESWRAYRQALRDLTDQPGFPGKITWPTAPSN